MDTPSNPAALLLRILQNMRAHTGDASTLNVLARAVGQNPTDLVGLSRSIVSIAELNARAKQAIELHVFGEKDMYLSPTKQIDEILADLNLTAPWRHQSHKIDDALIMGLKYADHFLSNSAAASHRSDMVTASALASSVEALIEDCLKADLDEDLRTFFADILERLRSGLTQFKIYGSAAFDRMLDEIVGAINRRRIQIDDQSEEAKSFIGRVFDTIGRVNDLVSTSDTLTKIATTGTIFFLPCLG